MEKRNSVVDVVAVDVVCAECPESLTEWLGHGRVIIVLCTIIIIIINLLNFIFRFSFSFNCAHNGKCFTVFLFCSSECGDQRRTKEEEIVLCTTRSSLDE